MAGVLDGLDILEQGSLSGFERVRLPCLTSLFQLFWWNSELDRILHSIDRDDVAILDQCDWATNLSFRDNMANAEAMAPKNMNDVNNSRVDGSEASAPSAESPIRQARNVLSKTCTHNQTRRLQHLWHSY